MDFTVLLGGLLGDTIQCIASFSGVIIATLIDFNNKLTTSLFYNDTVKAFIILIELIGSILFLAGIGFAFSDWAINTKEGNGNNVIDTFKNVFIGFIALLSFTTIPPLLLSFTNTLCSQLTTALSIEQINDYLQNVYETGIHISFELFGMPVNINIPNFFYNNFDGIDRLFVPIYVIIIAVCVVKVVLDNIKRGGIMLILMFICPFHIFNVPRGYTDQFYAWCKQMLAVCLTAFIESFLISLSLMIFANGELLLSIGVALSAYEAPRIMQQFGIDTSMRVNVSQAIYGVSGAMSIIRNFK